MKHRVFGKRLSRDTKGRKALIKSLVGSLVKSERIVITDTKAKILKSVIDKLISKAKKQTLTTRRQIIKEVGNLKIAAKIVDDLSLRFTDRNSGFTRLAKLGPRSTDRARVSVIEFVKVAAKEVKVDKETKKPIKIAKTKTKTGGNQKSLKAKNDKKRKS